MVSRFEVDLHARLRFSTQLIVGQLRPAFHFSSGAARYPCSPPSVVGSSVRSAGLVKGGDLTSTCCQHTALEGRSLKFEKEETLKRFLLVTCASLIIAAPASANLSRVAGMGEIGLFMMDDSDVLTFPQALADYTNRAIGELGFRGSVDSQRSAGVHMHLEKVGVHAGVWVNQPGPQLRRGLSNVANDGRHNVFGIAAEDGLWGLQVGVGGDKWELTPDMDPPDGTLIEEKTSTYSVAGGLDFNYSETANGELGAKINIASGSEDSQGDDMKIDETIFDVGVALRNTYDRGEHGKLVAVGTFNLGSGKIDFPTVAPRGGALEENKVDFLGAGAGVAWHYPVSSAVTVIAGVEPIAFLSAKETDTFEDSTEESKVTAISYLSMFFGMEANLNSWLVGRLGASQANLMIKEEFTFEDTSRGDPVTDEEKYTESAFQLSFGLGVKLGDNFMLDGVFNEDLFYTGPYFLTGDSVDGSGDHVLSRVSLWGWWD